MVKGPDVTKSATIVILKGRYPTHHDNDSRPRALGLRELGLAFHLSSQALEPQTTDRVSTKPSVDVGPPRPN